RLEYERAPTQTTRMRRMMIPTTLATTSRNESKLKGISRDRRRRRIMAGFSEYQPRARARGHLPPRSRSGPVSAPVFTFPCSVGMLGWLVVGPACRAGLGGPRPAGGTYHPQDFDRTTFLLTLHVPH